jgi:integrase
MPELTYTDLDDLCKSYLEVLPFYGQPEQVYFQILYDTGCRPAEIIRPNLWTWDGFGVVTLQPLKGNNSRKVYLSGDYPLVIEYFAAGETYLSDYSIGKFRFIWDKFNGYGQLTNRNKGIDLYCFRNRYVKYLKFKLGLQDEEIQQIMGWTNSHLPGIYYNAEILRS